MDGQQKIIDKILSDATRDAGEILSEAVKRAESMVEEKRLEVQRDYDAAVAEAQRAGSEVVKRKMTVSELEVKKIMLAAKSEAVDEVFKRSLAKLLSDGYEALIEKMVLSAADDGDVVVVSENDKKLFGQAFFDKISAKCGKKLTLSDTYGSFSGGVILCGKGVDKNLTLESELALLRDEIGPEVAKIMFGKKS